MSIISSSADFSFAKTLKNILRPLISNVWYYEDILAGDTIKSSVEKEIEESDIILILLSSDFFYELYSLEGYNKDMPKILSSFQNKGKAIFPVLLRSCIYDLLELGVLLNDCQFAFDEIPIYSYTLETRDEAINKIVKKVDLLLSNINDAFVRIAIPNWIGYAGGVYANKGLDANKDSELTKVSDKLVEFIVEDDLQK
ncbi:MAG: toll/interleukin-1 receptor domain-containing protein [Sphingobacteriales bacterium]|nr:toll/interleukin-1 receptor domain-containing protein [Sphingobacteriales bacterium]